MAQQFRKVTLVPADATQRADHYIALMEAYSAVFDTTSGFNPTNDPEFGWLMWWAEHRTIYDNCIDDLLFPARRK